MTVRARTARRLFALFGASTIVGTSTALVPSTPAADAAVTSFCRPCALNYALTYWASDPGPPFQRFGNDCTNFGSSVWHLGGGTWMNADWYIMNNIWGTRDYSLSWTVVENFVNYHRYDHYENGTIFATSSGGPNPYQDFAPGGSQIGDAIWYSWNDGGSVYDHLAIDVGAHYFSTYNDWYEGVNYTFNRTLTSIAQHTSDRVHAPWNFGFWRDYAYLGLYDKAEGMIFKTLHVNT